MWLMACAIQPSVTPCLGVIVNALPSLSLTMKLYPNLVRLPSSPSRNCFTAPKPATTVPTLSSGHRHVAPTLPRSQVSTTSRRTLSIPPTQTQSRQLQHSHGQARAREAPRRSLGLFWPHTVTHRTAQQIERHTPARGTTLQAARSASEDEPPAARSESDDDDDGWTAVQCGAQCGRQRASGDVHCESPE